MASISVTQWPVADADGLCLLQSTASGGLMLFNGVLSTIGTAGPVVLPGFNRNLTLTSANNNSTRNFIISGFRNGIFVSETLAGPNANTVTSVEEYDTITSVVVTGGASNQVSMGTGVSGATNWIKSCANTIAYAIAIQVEVLANTINYDFQVTLDDVTTNSDPITFNPVMDLTNASTTLLDTFSDVCNYYRINVRNTSNATGALTVTFLQQGMQ